MAQAAKAFGHDAAVAPTEPAGAGGMGEPVPVSLRGVDVELIDELPDEPPWCVDNGTSILVMSTAEIHRKRLADEFTGGIKVWRDGMPHWLDLDEVIELDVQTGGEDTPQSHIRLRKRPAKRQTLQGIAPAAALRNAAIYLFILLAGLVVGFIITAATIDAPKPVSLSNAASAAAAARSQAAIGAMINGPTALVGKPGGRLRSRW